MDDWKLPDEWVPPPVGTLIELDELFHCVRPVGDRRWGNAVYEWDGQCLSCPYCSGSRHHEWGPRPNSVKWRIYGRDAAKMLLDFAEKIMRDST